MYARFYNLWFVDHRSRSHLYIGSILIAFGYGVINNVLLGRPEGRVTWETLGVLCAITLGFTIVYCTRKEGLAVERKKASHPINWFVMTVAGAAVAMVISSLYISPGSVPFIYKENLPVADTVKLADIRATVQTAEARRMILQPSQIAKYKSTIRETSPSVAEYWTTMAAVINYQSLLNQMNGEAPDPANVAKPCLNENDKYNLFEGVPFQDCIITLDNETFEGVTFKDSVVIYHGGAVSLSRVHFMNCRFILQLSAQPAVPAQKRVFLVLLDSPDQTNVQISRTD